MSAVTDSSKKQTSKTSKASGCCGSHDGDDTRQHAATPVSENKPKGSQDAKSHSHGKGGSSGCCCGTGPHK